MTLYYIAWDSTVLTAATAKTIIELPTVANTEINLCELVIGCDATTAGSLLIQMGTFATTGTGTAATPQKWIGNPNIDSAITAAKIKDSVEPSTFDDGTPGGLLYPGLVIPLPGFHFQQWPLSREFTVAESINFAIRLTSTVTCNTTGYIAWDE
jgi:hypothetical protein